MNYVLGQLENDGSLTLDTITDKPDVYVSHFEPIDVIGGELVVWDENGTLYNFKGGGISSSEQKVRFGIVDVGEWDIKKGEPSLVKVRLDEIGLRKILVNFLTQEKRVKTGFLRRSKTTPAPYSTAECSKMTLTELINSAKNLLHSKSPT